jgi:hypothetical protein
MRASLEPFWDLKIGKHVEYLTPVSSEYLISCEVLSLTSSAGRTSRIFLIPWRLCAIYSMYSSVPQLKFGSCIALLIWLNHRNLSLSRSRVGFRLHLCDWGASMRYCVRTILTIYMHHLPLCSYWGHGQQLNKIEGWSGDGSAKKYTNKFVGIITSTMRPYAACFSRLSW